MRFLFFFLSPPQWTVGGMRWTLLLCGVKKKKGLTNLPAVWMYESTGQKGRGAGGERRIRGSCGACVLTACGRWMRRCDSWRRLVEASRPAENGAVDDRIEAGDEVVWGVAG